jgi:hypothetical protein
MAGPNYKFAKRSRELARQKKQEEKRLRRQHGAPGKEGPTPAEPAPGTGGAPVPEPGAPA